MASAGVDNGMLYAPGALQYAGAPERSVPPQAARAPAAPPQLRVLRRHMVRRRRSRSAPPLLSSPSSAPDLALLSPQVYALATAIGLFTSSARVQRAH